MVAPIVEASNVLRRIDAAIFSAPFLVIDAQNKPVATVPTLDDVQRFIREDQGTTWAAQTRQGASVIDLDIDHAPFTALVCDTLASWCIHRDIPYLVRASGASGHAHFIALTDAFTELFELYVEQLRDEMRLSSRQMDIRRTVRPLSAPHRSAGSQTDAIDIHAAQRFLESLAGVHLKASARRRVHTTTHAVGRPRRKPRETDSGDRSDDEFRLTLRLKNAGKNVGETWSAVRALDGHSAQRGEDWWRTYMWDRIRPARGSAPRVDARRAILPAIAARRQLLPELDTRAAHTLETVLWVLGERLTDDQWHPVSERDVRLCTGLSRNAIRNAWRAAEQVGILRSDAPGNPAEATSWAWGDAVTLSSLIDPPVLTPPASTWAAHTPPGTASAAASHHLHQPPPAGSTRQRQLQQARTAAAAKAGLLDGGPGLGHSLEQSPTWTEVQQERDDWHERIRASRASWLADRCTALAHVRRAQRAWRLAERPPRRPASSSSPSVRCSPQTLTSPRITPRILSHSHSEVMLI